jgi:ferric-dicitrate binding protein FerR (iron transport regulator)
MSALEVTDLIRRFVDDRDALTEQEYELLLAAVKSSPDLALQLRDQLVMDDVLGQQLAIDRGDFLAQVQQRVADHLRGEDELNRQADELRLLALARLESAPRDSRTPWSAYWTWGVALTLLLAASLGFWNWRATQQAAVLATIAELDGKAIVHCYPRASDEDAHSCQVLQSGDKLSLAHDAHVSLLWPDGTRVQLAGGTVIELPSASGKRVYVDRGQLAALVTPQPSGKPMIFATPHAEAIVRGTELYLFVQADQTRLDVAEGKVELLELATRDALFVASAQSATASPGQKIVLQTLQFPSSQQGLIYAFTGQGRPPLVRYRSVLRPTSLQPHGSVAADGKEGNLQLAGGWFEDEPAGSQISSALRSSQAMSIELVVAAENLAAGPARSIVSLGGTDREAWSLMQSGDKLLFQSSGGAPVELAALSQPGEPIHLVVTCDVRQLQAFLDGRRVHHSQASFPSMESATRLCLGGRDTTEAWRGCIQGLAIYDRALRGDEVQRNPAP